MAETKKNRRRSSLFVKYFAFFLAVELISLSVFGGVLFYFISYTWEDEQKQKLYEYSQNIAEIYESYIDTAGGNMQTSYAELCYAVSGVAYTAKAEIFVVSMDGSILFCNHESSASNENPGEYKCHKHPSAFIPGEVLVGIETDGMMATRSDLSGVYENEHFISATVVKNGDTEKTEGIVFVVQSPEAGLTPYRNNFLKIYIPAAVLMMVLTSLIIYISTYNITKPLREMSEATKRYSQGDFSYRIRRNNRNTVREFDELSAAMNSMAENLEQLENSRTQFVANVSHELKTPMTTIGGFIDGILDGTIDSEHQNQYLTIVSEEVKRLSRLVVSMLNMSKMEAGEMRIKPKRFNLTQQIIGIFMSFEQKIDNKKIDIKGLESLSNCYIEADPDMLSQVFYNLIDNAVKFTPQSGEIFTSLLDDGEYVTVKIRNTGEGIRSEDIDHVFERFYKGDKSRSLDVKSAGLGLFIVKNIVTLHGGEITVDSIYDKYTEFTVKLKIKLIG